MQTNITAVITIKDPIGIMPITPTRLAGALEAAIRHTWGATAENLKVYVTTSSSEKTPDEPVYEP